MTPVRPGRWWQEAVTYEVYVPSFSRGRAPDPARPFLPRGAAGAERLAGRVAGDLEGIRSRLEYLEWLGVDAIWLTPFYPSPLADFGYDVADYCNVNPAFGTLADYDALLEDAHARGIRIVVDWVPNHSSDRHPWFVESRSGRDSLKRDWYIWRDGEPDRLPNNWRATFVDAPAWSWDDTTGAWYLHLFLPEQPDINWANPEVEAAMTDVLRFWLDRGTDGFRIDVVHGIGKDPGLPDAPADMAAVPWSAQNDHESTHAIIRRLRRVIDSYPGERFMVGEVFLLSTGKVARYYGQDDELHLAFNFPPLFAPWDAGKWRHRIERVEEELAPRQAWPTWVLSNHDVSRHRTRYGSEARARAAAVLLLTLRGAPYMYMGEELGLEDAAVPSDAVVDPGGRDGCRAPIPWEEGPGHGWNGADRVLTWLPWPPDPDGRSVTAEQSDPGSTLQLYRRLLALRRSSPALRLGSWEGLEAPEGVLAYRRSHEGDARTVLVNYTGSERTVALSGDPGPLVAQVSSAGAGEGQTFSGTLGPDEAVVLGRAGP